MELNKRTANLAVMATSALCFITAVESARRDIPVALFLLALLMLIVAVGARLWVQYSQESLSKRAMAYQDSQAMKRNAVRVAGFQKLREDNPIPVPDYAPIQDVADAATRDEARRKTAQVLNKLVDDGRFPGAKLIEVPENIVKDKDGPDQLLVFQNQLHPRSGRTMSLCIVSFTSRPGGHGHYAIRDNTIYRNSKEVGHVGAGDSIALSVLERKAKEEYQRRIYKENQKSGIWEERGYANAHGVSDARSSYSDAASVKTYSVLVQYGAALIETLENLYDHTQDSDTYVLSPNRIGDYLDVLYLNEFNGNCHVQKETMAEIVKLVESNFPNTHTE